MVRLIPLKTDHLFVYTNVTFFPRSNGFTINMLAKFDIVACTSFTVRFAERPFSRGISRKVALSRHQGLVHGGAGALVEIRACGSSSQAYRVLSRSEARQPLIENKPLGNEHTRYASAKTSPSRFMSGVPRELTDTKMSCISGTILREPRTACKVRRSGARQRPHSPW